MMCLPPAKEIYTGEITGTTQAVRLDSLPVSYVKFKAQSGNSTNVYIGAISTLTVADGVSDTTTGFELDAGQETDWIPVANLNQLYVIANSVGDDLTYFAILS